MPPDGPHPSLMRLFAPIGVTDHARWPTLWAPLPTWQGMEGQHTCVAAGHVVSAVSAVLELEALCICTAEGALLLLHTGSQQLEQVGQLQGGVAAAAWSPDGALLLVLTALGRALLLNQVKSLLCPHPQAMMHTTAAAAPGWAPPAD